MRHEIDSDKKVQENDDIDIFTKAQAPKEGNPIVKKCSASPLGPNSTKSTPGNITKR